MGFPGRGQVSPRVVLLGNHKQEVEAGELRAEKHHRKSATTNRALIPADKWLVWGKRDAIGSG